MSELQESQRPISAGAKTGAGPAPKPNPSVNANPAAVKGTEQGISGVNTVTKPVSNPTQAVSAQPYTPVFTTDKIQHTKATRPKEYFDEQNRKNAEKKKQDNKNRKMILIIGAAIVGVLALIGIIWLVVIKANEPTNDPGTRVPIITNGSDEEVSKIREYLQDVYNNTNKENSNNDDQSKLNAADEALNDILNEPGGQEYINQINLAKMLFYFDNGLYSNIIAIKDSIDVNSLQPEQQITYYNTLYVTYQSLQDYEKANEYFVLSYNLSKELGGAGGPDE